MTFPLKVRCGRFLAAALVGAAVCACAAEQPPGREDAMRASLTDSLVHLYPDSDAARVKDRQAELDVARGGTAAVNVLVNGAGGQGRLEFAVRVDGREPSPVRWYRLVDVPVEVNTGPVSFVEKPTERNPHVTRRAPFRVYDAMEPVSSPIAVTGETAALRLEIPIPRDAQPGRRTYAVEIGDGERQSPLSLTVMVHDVVVPPAGKDSLPYSNWFDVYRMANRHGLEPWSEAHWNMIARYARLMARARQNTFWVPWYTIFEREESGLVLHRERLRRTVRTFTEAGMYYIEGGHVGAKSRRGIESQMLDIMLGGPGATTAEGHTDLVHALEQLRGEMESQGWRDRWMQHVADEPNAACSTDYRILAGMARKYMPGVPLVDATMNQDIVGAVDIWCPHLNEYQRNREFFEAQRAVGDRVWFYTSCTPGGPWLNRLMDMELVRPALFGWAVALYDLDGFLHWGLNHYEGHQDPFRNSAVRHHPSGNVLPAGDTHVVYPGRDGPWSSVRLEAQREGFEDYELLKQLKSKDPKAAARILARVIRAFDDYTKDAKVLRVGRKALLRALDQR